MNIIISGHHLEVTPAIREYVQKRLSPVLRHSDQLFEVQVTLSVEKNAEKQKTQKAEIHLRLPGKDAHVSETSADLYAAIDTATDKLDRQMLKYKDKQQDHHHQKPQYVDMSPDV